jgi:hypothetical protein
MNCDRGFLHGYHRLGTGDRPARARSRISDSQYLRDDEREVGLPLYHSPPSGRRRLHLAFLRSQIRSSDGAAGAAREARSFHPYGRAITGAVCAGVHQGLRRRDVAGRTRPDAGRSRAGGWAARVVPGSVYRRQNRTEASAAPCGRRF